MADAVYSGTEFQFGIAEEAVFGTAITVQGSFQKLFLTEPVQVGYGDIIRGVNKRSDGKRILSHTDIYVSDTGADYPIQVTGIATKATIDLLIYGVMQDLISEASVSPNLKSFEWDGDSGAVDFSVNNGKTFTLLGYDPETAYNWQIPSTVVKTLTVNVASGTNEGRMSFSATFYSGFAKTFGVTATPDSWISPGVAYYPIQLLDTKTIDGTSIVIDGFSLNLDNKAMRVGYDSSGYPVNYALAANDPLSVTGELSAKYDAATSGEIAKFLTTPDGGTAERNIIVRWGDGVADGTLNFDINAVYTGNEKSHSTDMGTFVKLPFEAVDDGVNEALAIDIANSINRGW